MKKVLITGSSSGIGLATAECLHEQGYEVTGVSRNRHDSAAITNNVSIDLANISKLPDILKSTEILNQGFDVLVLNAGYGQFGGLEQFSHQQITDLINTNLISNLFLIKHYLPEFKRQGRKDIVIIGSESAIQGAKQGSVYCASKFALRGLAQSLRADVSSSDIRVILVNPGPVDTSFFNELHFSPEVGEDYSIDVLTIAETISHSLKQPRSSVIEEINIQPIKKSFRKK